jgi:FSR family fosmidomycin resistance protein-like MFS transporter
MQKINPLIYLLAFGHFVTDWAQGAVPALLPYFITACHLNYQDAASLIFANLVIASVSQPLFGYYSDKFSKSWFVPLGPVLCGTALSIIAFSTNYWVIFFSVMMCGLGSSVFHPEAALMVNRISGKLKGQALGTFSVGGNAGFAVGPLLAGLCAYKYSIHGMVLFGIINFAAACFMYYHMPTILAQAAATTAQEKKATPGGLHNDWPSFSKLFVLIVVRSVAFTLCNSFIPIYWIDVLHTSPTTGSMALTILFTLGAFLTYAGGVMSDRWGNVKVIKLTFFIMIPAMFALNHTGNELLAFLLLLPVGISVFLAYSPTVYLGQTYLSKNIGFASGITMGLSASIGGLTAPFVGHLADLYGVAFALNILWIMGVVAFIFSFLIPEVAEPKKKLS